LVLDALLAEFGSTKKTWLGSMLAENAWSADSEWGGVKALCGAAQECRHLLDGTIYPPVNIDRT